MSMGMMTEYYHFFFTTLVSLQKHFLQMLTILIRALWMQWKSTCKYHVGLPLRLYVLCLCFTLYTSWHALALGTRHRLRKQEKGVRKSSLYLQMTWRKGQREWIQVLVQSLCASGGRRPLEVLKRRAASISVVKSAIRAGIYRQRKRESKADTVPLFTALRVTWL